MSRIINIATRVPLEQAGYSLFSIDELGSDARNTAVTRAFDVVVPRHVSRAIGGCVITTSEQQSLLYPTIDLGWTQVAVPRMNYGLSAYLRQLQEDGLIRLDREIEPPRVQPADEISLPTESLSNHSHIVGQLMTSNESALLVREPSLSLEELAVSIALAFPRTRILFLANSQRILSGVVGALQQAGLMVALTTRASMRRGFRPPAGVSIVASTIARTVEFQEWFSLVVVLDQSVLDRNFTQHYFHQMISRFDRQLPRILGIVKAGRSYSEHFTTLCATYGYVHVHLAGSERVRKTLQSLRLPFDQPEGVQDWDARREMLRRVVLNYKRNRRIARIANRMLRPEASNYQVPRQLRNWARVVPNPRIAIVVDELLHASELLRELTDWKLVTRLEASQLQQSRMRSSAKNRLVSAKERQQGQGVIVVSDSFRQARRYDPDVILYAGGTARFPDFPNNWLYTRDVSRPCLLIDLSDVGVSRLSFNASRRRQQLTGFLIPDLGQDGPSIRLTLFHQLQMAARGRRARR